MSYKKTKWEAGKTIVSARNLNNIEDAVETLSFHSDDVITVIDSIGKPNGIAVYNHNGDLVDAKGNVIIGCNNSSPGTGNESGSGGSGNDSGGASIKSFLPFTIDTPIPLSPQSMGSAIHVFMNTTYGITGDTLGFGDAGYGTESYLKLLDYETEFDFENNLLYLSVSKDYNDEYDLEEIDSNTYKLISKSTNIAFMVKID